MRSVGRVGTICDEQPTSQSASILRVCYASQCQSSNHAYDEQSASLLEDLRYLIDQISAERSAVLFYLSRLLVFACTHTHTHTHTYPAVTVHVRRLCYPDDINMHCRRE